MNRIDQTAIPEDFRIRITVIRMEGLTAIPETQAIRRAGRCCDALQMLPALAGQVQRLIAGVSRGVIRIVKIDALSSDRPAWKGKPARNFGPTASRSQGGVFKTAVDNHISHISDAGRRRNADEDADSQC